MSGRRTLPCLPKVSCIDLFFYFFYSEIVTEDRVISGRLTLLCLPKVSCIVFFVFFLIYLFRDRDRGLNDFWASDVALNIHTL